ncbi:MAG: PQQ-binding-like beta-propeller repeat protein [Pirellulales bacterium]|nr:PQQ-binding-like beta-propeller repeat protein [Pirellulales bacterium]
MPRGLSLLVLLLSLTLAAQAAELKPAPTADANWPQFRGPGSLGTAEGSNLPDRWTATENVQWKTAIPGLGWSSPIVWQDKVFLTTVVSEGEVEAAKRGLYFGGERKTPPTAKHQWKVYCLDLESGQILWDRVAHEGVPEMTYHIKNTLASETPVTDGERVYAYFGNLGLFAFDFAGNQLWSVKFPVHNTRYGWGTAASPVLHDGRIYIVDDNDDESYLVAIDAREGKELWRTPRTDEKSNWATPYVWQNEQRTEIVTPGTVKTRSYDLDGKLLWEFAGMSSITICTPFSRDGLLYIGSGYVLDKLKPLYAIRPGASGDISLGEDETSNEFIAWCNKGACSYNPTPVLYGDNLYVLLDRGFLACYNARTGEEVFGKQRIPNARGFTASPWAYNGKIFCCDEYGVTFVIEAGPEFKILHENPLGEDEMCMATPAIVGDKLLIRTDQHLYCIRHGARG